MHVTRVAEMRSLDSTAIRELGIPAELLMENAGHAVYSVIRSELGTAGKTFVVFCGLGNNGGDGLVVARKLHANGAAVRVLILGDPERFTGAAQTHFEIASRVGISIAQVEAMDAVREEVARCDAIVDAMLGTGLTRDLRGTLRDAVECINQSGKRVFAVDIPSGIHGDTGQAMGAAVRADHTVTFGLPKLGNVLPPGCHVGGQLYVSHISFPPSLTRADSLQISINLPLPLPARDPDGHKGDFGQALFIGGAAGYYGAPYFAALALLKAGGGYSRLALPRAMVPFVANRGSEIVFVPQAETPAGSIGQGSKSDLLELANRMDMVVLGPGLSLDPETQELARGLTALIERPLLIDGDGITAVCENLQCVADRSAETVLTPHLGEMARVTGLEIGAIEGDKVDVLQRTTRELDATIVLKGAHSLIGYPDGRVFVNMSGNSGMATAGSGDVLTGAIAAMFGLGLPLGDAVRQGVLVHGLAGDIAAHEKGEDGITAQDVLDFLPLAVKTLRANQDDSLGGWLQIPRVV